jgi:hypothetical protein
LPQDFPYAERRQFPFNPLHELLNSLLSMYHLNDIFIFAPRHKDEKSAECQKQTFLSLDQNVSWNGIKRS